MKWLSLLLALTICSTFTFPPVYSFASDDDAKLEATFNELCGRTENAEALTVEKLTTMVSECDTLEEKITQSSHPKKKILLFRLKKCRNFLHFMIQTKQLESSKQ